MTQAFIITDTPKVGALADFARTFASSLTAVTLGNVELGGVDKVVRIPLAEGQPAEALAPVLTQYLASQVSPGDVLLAPDTPVGRVCAAAASVALSAPIFTSVQSLESAEETTRLRLSRYGGLADSEVELNTPVVIIADGGAELAGTSDAEEITNAGAYAATISAETAPDGDNVELSAAERVVVAGRGFAEKEDLAMAHELASALGAELGCTRPLSEGIAWMETERYIGISGVNIAPELYIGAGVSGQIQHTAGITGAKTIVAINDDSTAPIFEIADYAIVGDLYQIVPALSAELKK
ncbi:MAG: electron transfer flavoprotein subunit alpha/FixB family protein [Actinomycetaceae bacterium]|nr:electron transfer flavoprotein subunit alpha/FixB family protein [Actinomycetaceae bacterium]